MSISAAALIFAAACLASSDPTAPSTIKFAFYAPKAFYWPDQADPPVRIVGFENSRSEISFVLSNTSDKAVIGVGIINVMVSPAGCATNSEHESASSAAVYPVTIAPHGTAILSRDEMYTKIMVYNAEDFGTHYLQTQFAIIGVYFQDGTTWPVPILHNVGTQPPDSELVKSTARNCSGPSAMDPSRSEQIVFEPQTPQADDFDAEHSSIPQLHFRCRIEGPKAICQMPESRRSKH